MYVLTKYDDLYSTVGGKLLLSRFTRMFTVKSMKIAGSVSDVGALAYLKQIKDGSFKRVAVLRELRRWRTSV